MEPSHRREEGDIWILVGENGDGRASGYLHQLMIHMVGRCLDSQSRHRQAQRTEI